MRTPSTILVLFLAFGGALGAQTRASDSMAILHVIERRSESMRTLDAPSERAVFAPDAVWINAFGRRRTGPDSIEVFLRLLYADSGYRESRFVR